MVELPTITALTYCTWTKSKMLLCWANSVWKILCKFKQFLRDLMTGLIAEHNGSSVIVLLWICCWCPDGWLLQRGCVLELQAGQVWARRPSHLALYVGKLLSLAPVIMPLVYCSPVICVCVCVHPNVFKAHSKPLWQYTDWNRGTCCTLQ